MKIIKFLIELYIDSSIHVAIAVYSLLKITEMYFGLAQYENFENFVFFSTIFAYNLLKNIADGALFRKTIYISFLGVQLITLGSLLFAIYYAIQLPVKTILFFIPLVSLTILYAVPLLGISKRNLRNLPFLKIWIVSLVWSSITVLMPFLSRNYSINTEVFLVFIQRFLMIVVLILPFEIRDLNFDKLQLHTLPQLVGVSKTKKIGFIMMAVMMIIEFFVAPNYSYKINFLIIFTLLLIFLQKATVNQHRYYSSFWVESIPIFWWILLLITVS